jgi:hypothetical protein
MRIVTLVLHEPHVVLPAFCVPLPWWSEAESVVAEARRRWGLSIVVLRLLGGERLHDGPVTYLAELRGGDASWGQSTREGGDDHALRMPWARPGGPQADLDWAAEQQAFSGEPVQVRTWNLSSVWRLPTRRGTLWLKHVPPFFAHEGAVLQRLGRLGAPVPEVVAQHDGLSLLAEVPGIDGYEAPLAQQLAAVDRLVALQTGVDPLTITGLGAPDWRADKFQAAAAEVVAREAPEELRPALEALVAQLPQRFAALADCGLPDTLVHGDFHRGNLRLTDAGPVILDWSDSGIGHPLLDLAAFLERNPDAPAVREHWLRLWKRAVPRSDPDRAAFLVAPIAALRQALIYRKFLDHIEPTEHVYHRGDPALWLTRAASLPAGLSADAERPRGTER